MNTPDLQQTQSIQDIDQYFRSASPLDYDKDIFLNYYATLIDNGYEVCEGMVSAPFSGEYGKRMWELIEHKNGNDYKLEAPEASEPGSFVLGPHVEMIKIRACDVRTKKEYETGAAVYKINKFGLAVYKKN